MKKSITLTIVLLGMASAGITPVAVQASEIAMTIDGASPGRVFEGVGALSAGASSMAFS